MALTVTRPSEWFFNAGNVNIVQVNVAFDNSYVQGGESFTPADAGLSNFLFVYAVPTSGIVFEYDYTNKKLKALVQGVQHAASGAATPDDFQIQGVASNTSYSISIAGPAGAGTAYFGTLKECSNTADLSSITGVRVFAVGY